jgi:hypothetical protein
LPQQAIIERVLNVSSDEAAAFAAQGAFQQLLTAANTPDVQSPSEPAANGNGIPGG